jgi:hypothetical protein
MSPEPVALAHIDPQALLSMAIEKGAGIETLERLVNLTKEIRAWTAREAWYQAMAEFQKRCPIIKKSKSAKIATRTGGSYSYSYAPLDEILSTIQELMGELGLSVSWRTRVEGHAVVANCWIAHQLGHHEESGDIVMPFQNDGRMNPAQVVGSASTYAKRYALLAILGMAPEDDDDAHGADPKPGREPERPVEDVDVLFPDPEQERLVRECGDIIKHGLINKVITQKDVRAMKATYLGAEDADPSKCDVAALTDLRKYLAARFEKDPTK